MHSKAKSPTKAEKQRFARLADLGCVACIKEYKHCPMPVEIHHLLDGGTRRGHSYTIPLCGYHHQGRPIQIDGISVPHRNMYERYGPSLAVNGRAFHSRYGTDDELLAYTNELIAKLEQA